jgi:hypothetical protein
MKMNEAQLKKIIDSKYWKECFDDNTESYYKLIDIYLYAENGDIGKEKGYEVHHIIPRSFYKKKGLSVDNSESNLIKLKPSEHYMAHYYMSKCAKKLIKRSMVYALHLMTQTATKRHCEFSAEQFSIMYEEAKSEFVKIQKIDCSLKHLSKEVRIAGFKKAMQNRSKNEAYKKQLSERMRGNKINKGNTKYNLEEINAITGLHNLGFTQQEISRYFPISNKTIKNQVEVAIKKYGKEKVLQYEEIAQPTRSQVFVYDKLLDNILSKTEAEQKEGVSDVTFLKRLQDENYRYCIIKTWSIADIYDFMFRLYQEDVTVIDRIKAEMERMKAINQGGENEDLHE